MNPVTRDEILILSRRARDAGQTDLRDLLLMVAGLIDADGRVYRMPTGLFSDAMTIDGAWGKGLKLVSRTVDNPSCKV